MRIKLKAMVLGGFVIMGVDPASADFEFASRAKNLTFTKEMLDTISQISTIPFQNKNGQTRYLQAGEVVEVKTHEEDGSISFSTVDMFSIRVHQSELSSPRNISNQTGL